MFNDSIVALVTPFNETGAVDFGALCDLIQWHIDEGSKGLVLCGSTGEGSSLSREEKLAVFRAGVEVSKGRIPIIAGTGTNQTAESVALTQEAKTIGVDGCLVVVPYYSRPSVEGCFLHFSEVAKVGVPMIAYYHPGRTGVKLSVDALVRICGIDGIVAIKEASGDLDLALSLMRKVETPLLCGNDSLALSSLALGFTGCISIVGNVIPKVWADFVGSALSGDFVKAREQFFQLAGLTEAMVLETNPQCVKYALSLLGKCKSGLRLPLVEPSLDARARLLDELCNEARPASLVRGS